MKVLDDKAIAAVEPMTIVGRTAGGDWLLEDRDGRKRSLRAEAMEMARVAFFDTVAAESLAKVEEAAAAVEVEPEPAPEPKPAPRKRAVKKK